MLVVTKAMTNRRARARPLSNLSDERDFRGGDGNILTYSAGSGRLGAKFGSRTSERLLS